MKKRVTKLVRVEASVHEGLKIMARDCFMTMSKLVSKICRPPVEEHARKREIDGTVSEEVRRMIKEAVRRF